MAVQRITVAIDMEIAADSDPEVFTFWADRSVRDSWPSDFNAHVLGVRLANREIVDNPEE